MNLEIQAHFRTFHDRLGLSLNPLVNAIGGDIEPALVEKIDDFCGGTLDEPLEAWERAQLHELAFWRWVAFRGYEGINPRCFSLWQRIDMACSYRMTGWPMDRFASGRIVEIGCGPLGKKTCEQHT